MTETRKTLRAAIYARISEDTAGEARGVARQLEDARALAQARGWETVSEFTDNDISAFSGVRRPGYEALMAAVDDRLIDRIVVYQTSRLWRSRKERAIAIERLADAKVGIVAVSGPDLDLSSASGRMLAGILGEFDTAESAIKSERVARASEQRATEGRPSGGLGYGWHRLTTLDDRGNAVTTGHEIDEDEAAIVREVVKRLTAGETLKAVTSDLNERGVIAPGSEHRRGYRAADNAAGERW
ncbi:MAG TPA: recombinase family protein, partial [Acidothermaceae bacterium]